MQVLKRGSQGSEVREWQNFLIKQGLLKVGAPTGNFADQTHQATVQFQRKHKLKDDGIVGQNTLGQAQRLGFRPASPMLNGTRAATAQTSTAGKNQPEVLPSTGKHYKLDPGIDVPAALLQKVEVLANQYFASAGKKIRITSGYRDPRRQAQAMIDLLTKSVNWYSLYKQDELVREIEAAYKQYSNDSKRVEAMAAVIQKQVDRGKRISRHLTGRAIDVSSHHTDGTKVSRSSLVAAAQKLSCQTFLNEGDHYHIDW